MSFQEQNNAFFDNLQQRINILKEQILTPFPDVSRISGVSGATIDAARATTLNELLELQTNIQPEISQVISEVSSPKSPNFILIGLIVVGVILVLR